MTSRTLRRVAGATLLVSFLPAAPAAGETLSPGMPPAGALRPAAVADPAIASFYAQRRNAPLWLVENSGGAAQTLVAILRRAPLDGLSEGPALAAEAEAMIARASGNRQAMLAADMMLSAAWVRYVEALRTPPAGMVYGDPYLAPRPLRPDQILGRAAAAGSLAGHIAATSAVNPVYARLRDAAWEEMQASGASTPDRRLLANLERARVLPARGRYIMVDAASAQLFMLDDGRIVDSMRVIVGKPSSQTPMLASTIHYATLNPYWNVPSDLAQKLIAPRVLEQGPAYLKQHGYEVLASFDEGAEPISPSDVDWKAVADGRATVKIRQLPGPGNSMGRVKFGFENSGGIFLHDTPDKSLFAKDERTLSNGCVRLEDAARLSRWLGQDPSGVGGRPEQHMQLARGVPIYITYLTVEAGSGRLAFREDVYGRDMAAGGLVAMSR